MIDKNDQELIDWLRHAGHGWARFAASVERQGFVSHRQRVTMHGMRHKIENHRHWLRTQTPDMDYGFSDFAEASLAESTLQG